MGQDFKEKYKVSETDGPKVIDFAEKKMERKMFAPTVPVERYASVEDWAREEQRKQEQKKRYHAQKGSAYRAQQNRKKHRKLNPRFIALILSILATGSAIGMISSTVGKIEKEDKQTLTTSMEEKVDISQLGLSSETINSLSEYEKYFENSTSKSINGQNLSMLAENLYQTNLTVIKEKIATITGYPAENIEVWISFDNADGRSATTIKVYENSNYKDYEKPVQIYNDSGANLFSIKDETTLPQEVCDIAWQLSGLSDVERDLANHKISDSNAWKKLNGYFNNLKEFSTKELIRDEKGNLAMISYDSLEEQLQNREQDERE